MKMNKNGKILKSVKTILYVYIILLLSNGNLGLLSYRITNHHLCLSPESVLYVINGVSVQQCVEECASLSDCSAVNYKRRFKLCELHSNLHENLVTRLDGLCVYVKRADIYAAEVSE